MILLKDIIENCINIFTDASIKKIGQGYIGCYGAIVMSGYNTIDQSYRIISNTTNNNSEIKAVREGILMAIKHRDLAERINLFSDSQLCIFGLRERILRWKVNIQNDVPTYFGSTGQVISNQDIFSEVASLILDYDLKINLLHQAGHIDFRNQSLLDGLHVFCSSNGIRDKVDINLIRYISNCNNCVDNMTRRHLSRIPKCQITSPIIYFANPSMDKSKYKSLVPNKVQFK